MDVVLDTDIGTNVDDVLGLVLLACDANVELRAVTTVGGDVALRARHALRVLHLLGRDDVPVHAGIESPPPERGIWPLESGGPFSKKRKRVSRRGVDALIQAVRRSPGDVTMVAIGPLTNIAAAIARDPGWARSLRRLVVMGGDFANGTAEHNLASDVGGARTVLSSGAPMVFVGLDVTTTVTFDNSDLDAMARSESPLVSVISDQARAWWRRIGRQWSYPHDALAVLTLLEPDLFEFGRGGFRLLADGSIAPDSDAPLIDYATAVDGLAGRASLHRRWMAALRGAGHASS
jgi:purine nucleosidase